MPNSSSRRTIRSEEPGNPTSTRADRAIPPSTFQPADSDPDAAIQLQHLSKTYGRLTALSDVSLEVRRGEIFGFLGLNGAGKTTTIRIMLDLVRPRTGRAMVDGIDCRRAGIEVRSRIGYLPGELGFYGDMTGAATLNVLARLSAADVDRSRQRELLDRMQLSDRDLRRRIREYSTGMKRKLGIVQAFQADPPLLILDEPTEGLDPLMQDALYELLAETRRRGKTVFMSSHVLSEVERVCDRIALLKRGELVLVSAVQDLRGLAARLVRVAFREDVEPPSELSARLRSECEVVSVTPRVWTLRIRGPLGPLLAITSRLPVDDLEVREPHLEEVVKTYYTDEITA